MFNSAHLGLICLTSRWTVLLSTPAGAHVYSPESETSNLMSNFYCHANTFIVLTSYFFGFLMVLTKSLAPGKPTYNTICCTGVYKSSYDLMEKKIPTEICFLIPILICQILTPIIQWQKNKLNNLKNNQSVMPRPQRSSTQSLNDNVTTNQNIPNLENLAFYFIANIFFILAAITIGLANG